MGEWGLNIARNWEKGKSGERVGSLADFFPFSPLRSLVPGCAFNITLTSERKRFINVNIGIMLIIFFFRS